MSEIFGRISPAQAHVVFSARGKDGSKKKITRLMPDPNISVSGHAVLALIFYGLFIAHIVLAGIEFANLPPTSTVLLDAAENFPPVIARLRVACKTTARPCGPMVLTVNYSGFAGSACYGSGPLVDGTTPIAEYRNGLLVDHVLAPVVAGDGSSGKDSFVDVPLCFTRQESVRLGTALGVAAVPLSMVQVGFFDLNQSAASLTVDAALDRADLALSSDKTAHRFINVDADNSVKRLPITATVETLDGAITNFQPTAEFVEFEGFRGNNGRQRSDVLLMRQSQVWHRQRTYTRTWWDLVTNIGSAFETLLGFMPILLPVWGVLFAADKNWLNDVLGKKPAARKYEADKGAVESSKVEQNSIVFRAPTLLAMETLLSDNVDDDFCADGRHEDLGEDFADFGNLDL